jgi:hypothetical protein
MSQQPLATTRSPQPARPRIVPPFPRPKWHDFILILLGFSLSLLLADMSGLQAAPGENTPAWWGTEPAARLLLHRLPSLLFLPVGVLLFWPLFYLNQRMAGRHQPITVGEWLGWVVWLAALALAGLIVTAWFVWQRGESVSAFFEPETFKYRLFVGYAVGILSLAAVALLIGVVDLFARWPRSWTHTCVLALVMWPALPLLALLVWKIQMR